jgi:hypothetical protein
MVHRPLMHAITSASVYHPVVRASPKQWDALHERRKCPRQDVGYSKCVGLLAPLTTMRTNARQLKLYTGVADCHTQHSIDSLQARQPTCVSISRVRKSSMSGCSPSVTKYGVPGVPLEMANRAASARFLQHGASIRSAASICHPLIGLKNVPAVRSQAASCSLDMSG